MSYLKNSFTVAYTGISVFTTLLHTALNDSSDVETFDVVDVLLTYFLNVYWWLELHISPQFEKSKSTQSYLTLLVLAGIELVVTVPTYLHPDVTWYVVLVVLSMK